MSTLDLTQTSPEVRRRYREAVLAREQARAAAARRNAQVSDYPSPMALARALDPGTVQTPALSLIDEALVGVERAVSCMLRRRLAFALHRQEMGAAEDEGETEQEAWRLAARDVPDEGETRLIISMPPQEGKSQATTHYGMLWLLRRYPNLRIGIVSYSEDIARGFSFLSRNDVASFTGVDGGVDLGLKLRVDGKAAGRWLLAPPHRGGMYAVGIGGSLTGRPLDVLCIDDPVKDARGADSSTQSEFAWMWWQSVARPRLAPGAPVILILTRWSELDLAGRLVAKQREDEKAGLGSFDRWKVINIPAQADHDPARGQVDPLGREPGEFMLSARGRSEADWLATKASVTPRFWSAVYQQRPTPDAGDVLKRQWWRRYSSPIWSGQPDGSMRVLECDEVLQSWDMAFKDTKSSDYVVGQVWARRGAETFLVDQVRNRLNFTDTVAAVRLMTAKWPQARVKLVEDKANGTAVIDSLRKEIGGIIPVTPKESKEARASAVAPFVEAGNVALPTADIALFPADELIEEATVFPNGQHDDQVDALSQALGRFYLRPGQGQIFKAFWRDQTAEAAEQEPVPPELAALPRLGREQDVQVCRCRPGTRRFFQGRCTVCQGVKPAE